MKERKNIAFNFGQNWKDFSCRTLDENRLTQAADSLVQLVGIEKIRGKRIIDIGCGSGLFSIAASKLGAKEVIAVDISKESVEASLENKEKFCPKADIKIFHKSIFDDDISKLGSFDLIYCWGVLHHTGDMFKAIDICLKLVSKRGLLVTAIYNKHWSSPLWMYVKLFYNFCPSFLKPVLTWFFYAVIALSKFFVTGKNPFIQKKRGMSFYYDLIDWLGGYPYEYAESKAIKDFIESRGFSLVKFVKSFVPTGCNEFVFAENQK